MKRCIILCGTVLFALQLQAQEHSSPAGEYLLTGEREMAAGFQLDSNGRFRFFFSYGALDRQATGTWQKHDDSLVLNSEPKGVRDFQLTEAKQSSGTQVRLFISGAPKEMMSYIQATVFFKNKQATATANEKGWMVLPLAGADSLVLQFLWCPEKVSRFTLGSSANNQFSFRLLPGITDVVFDNFTLQMSDDTITGVLPFSGDHVCRFQRKTTNEQKP